MTIDQWITRNHKDNLREVKRICKGHPLYDELYQECILILLEYNQEKLQGILDRNQLKFFFISIILRQYISNSSPFHVKFRKHAANRSDADVYNMDITDEEEYDHSKDELIKYIENEITQKDWYTKEILKLKFKDGMSYRQISKLTNIPPTSIYNTVNKARKEIIENHGSKKD